MSHENKDTAENSAPTKSVMYKKLDPAVAERIESDRANHVQNPYRCQDSDVLRRNMIRDRANLWRTPFVRDTEKILHLPVYNRYADKTQVFSFYKNDDITRRALHVQIVSRVARTIGAVLGLNCDLIEAVALGHDIGHTPFGHVGERYLSDLLHKETGLYFNHNVHSVRVIDTIFNRNVSLQTLDGIICHNGEFEMQEYRPHWLTLDENIPPAPSIKTDHPKLWPSAPDAPKFTQPRADAAFEQFDRTVADCDWHGDSAIKKLVPMTLESCVVRICDMIAYLGKDRQDAMTAKLITDTNCFSADEIGVANASIINNLTVDIINNSYGKDHILISENFYRDIKRAKKENYEKIYLNDRLARTYDETIAPMFKEVYYRLLDDLLHEHTDSPVYKHHIEYIEKHTHYYLAPNYRKEEPNRIVTDYIASMTDDYFIDLHGHLFPDSPLKVEYTGYFEEDPAS